MLPIVIIGVIIFMCIVFSTLLCYFGKYESIGKKLRKVCYQAINGKRISESDNKLENEEVSFLDLYVSCLCIFITNLNSVRPIKFQLRPIKIEINCQSLGPSPKVTSLYQLEIFPCVSG